jgi:hypothetical protein
MAQKSSPHYKHLKTKWLKRHDRLQKKLWHKHGTALDWLKKSTQQFVAGSLASVLMFTSPMTTVAGRVLTQIPPSDQEVHQPEKTTFQLVSDLTTKLPEKVEPLTEAQEKTIAETLTHYFSMPVAAELDGKRLNRSYGLIGAEQHLMRYPGDVVENMAPGRGAWGCVGILCPIGRSDDTKRH